MHHIRIRKFAKLYCLGKILAPWIGQCECGRQWQADTWSGTLDMTIAHLRGWT